jgi:hypothetical protein
MQVGFFDSFDLIGVVFFRVSRFIINIPAEQREDLVRVLFAVELAHWFFIDFYCEDYNDLHVCNIKEFAQQSKIQLLGLFFFF